MSDDIINHPDLVAKAVHLPANQWRRSSFCGTAGACVEVAELDDGAVAIRDGAARGDCLVFSAAEWAAFVGGVKAGEFG